MNICKAPFNVIEIAMDGSIHPCCPAYTSGKSFMGNVYTTDFDRIWHGPKAIGFREKIMGCDYSDCDMNLCINDHTKPMHFATNAPSATPDYPTIVKFCHDDECNYRCITCRDKTIRNSQEKLELLDSYIDTKFIPLLKNARIAILSGNGEPFASRHYLHLIARIAEAYPDIQFGIHTNGSLCHLNKLQELNIVQRVPDIYISIHAATKETYKTITRTNNFDRLLANMESLAPIIGSGQTKLHLYFVVSNVNFMEMPAFVKLAQRFGADATFWECRDWGTEFCQTRSRMEENDRLLKLFLQKIQDEPNVSISKGLTKYASLL